MRHICLFALVALSLVTATAALAKPGAPVALQPGALNVQPHSQLQAQVAIVVRQHVDTLRVRVLPPDGLRSVSGGLAGGFAAAAGEVVEVPLLIEAGDAGRGYVNLLITTQRRGRLEHRALAVPVAVGAGKLQLRRQGKLQAGTDGSPVVVLPVQETIR